MHVITVEFRIRRGREKDFLLRMRAQADNSLQREEGCLRFDVCVAPDDPAQVFLYEIYRDEAAFQAHLDTPHFKDFDAATADWVSSKAARAWHRDHPAGDA